MSLNDYIAQHGEVMDRALARLQGTAVEGESWRDTPEQVGGISLIYGATDAEEGDYDEVFIETEAIPALIAWLQAAYADQTAVNGEAQP